MASPKRPKMSPYEQMYAKMRNREALAIYNLEKKYNRNQNAAIYIPLEDAAIDWYWNPKEVSHFDYLWNTGVSLEDMAEELKRPVLEVVLMIFDRDYRGKIKPRKGGYHGF